MEKIKILRTAGGWILQGWKPRIRSGNKRNRIIIEGEFCQQCSLAGSCRLGWRGSPHLPKSHGICGCGTSPLQSSSSSLLFPAAPGSFPDGLELSGHASELLYLLSAPAKISIPTLWKNIRQPDIKEWCEEAELCQGSTNTLK